MASRHYGTDHAYRDAAVPVREGGSGQGSPFALVDAAPRRYPRRPHTLLVREVLSDRRRPTGTAMKPASSRPHPTTAHALQGQGLGLPIVRDEPRRVAEPRDLDLEGVRPCARSGRGIAPRRATASAKPGHQRGGAVGAPEPGPGPSRRAPGPRQVAHQLLDPGRQVRLQPLCIT